MTLLLDAALVPRDDRPGYWSAGVRQHFFPVHFAPRRDQAFTGRIVGGRMGPVDVRSIRGGSHRIARTPRDVTAGDPESLLLYLVRDGSCRVEQDGRRCYLRTGEIASHDTSRPSLVESDGGMDMVLLSFPKWLLGSQARRFARHTATPIAGDRPTLVGYAVPLLSGLAEAALSGSLGPQEGDASAELVLGLMRSLHGSDTPSVPRAQCRSLLTLMREYILRHLGEPDLGPERIARVHAVSTRYVHKIFAAAGTGVAEWIREQRLDGAVRDLRDPTQAHRPITSIAAAWGFGDPAGFSRVVRRNYGRSPSELRRLA